MSRRIVKVQIPIGGTGEPSILIYDESRDFHVLVEDPASIANIVMAQTGALKAYWYAEINDAERTFKLTERAPDQEW